MITVGENLIDKILPKGYITESRLRTTDANYGLCNFVSDNCEYDNNFVQKKIISVY